MPAKRLWNSCPHQSSWHTSWSSTLQSCERDGDTWLRPPGQQKPGDRGIPNGVPSRIDAVVISTQHQESVTHKQIERDMIEKVIKHVIPADLLDGNTKFFVNPTGKFVLGGPSGDTRSHRSQDYRGQLRWLGTTRGRGILWERSIQGRSQCRLRCPLCCQKHRGGRACQQVRGTARLRYRSR